VKKIQRYNQGFFKFGPMERCDTGEWVKAKDVDTLRSQVKTYEDLCQELNGRLEHALLVTKNLSSIASNFKQESLDARIKAGLMEKRVVLYAFTAAVAVAVEIVFRVGVLFGLVK